jgi:RNA polymerase sigma factor (sigma-70 family)
MTEVSTTDLVAAAGAGDRKSWDALVDRYARLVWSVIRGFRLDEATAGDVSQTVWLRLVENLERIRNPERLASWLATTARNEAIRTKRLYDRTVPTAIEFQIVDSDPAVDAGLLATERDAEVAAAFATLGDDCQELLRAVTADPPLDYETIAEMLGRPIGSIGPTRARCLEKLRRALESIRADAGEVDRGRESKP